MIVASISRAVGYAVCRRFTRTVLSSIEHYHGQVRVELVTVTRREVFPLSRFAVESRLQRATTMLASMQQCNATPFELVTVEDGQGTVRVVFPPVVERHHDHFVLVDGVHRFLAASQAGVEHIHCAVIEGAGIPPVPCPPGSWDELIVDDQQRAAEEVLPGLDRLLFRPLTSLFNSSAFVFSSLREALEFVETTDGHYARKDATNGRVQLDIGRRACRERGA